MNHNNSNSPRIITAMQAFICAFMHLRRYSSQIRSANDMNPIQTHIGISGKSPFADPSSKIPANPAFLRGLGFG